jgi:hypothetical protein
MSEQSAFLLGHSVTFASTLHPKVCFNVLHFKFGCGTIAELALVSLKSYRRAPAHNDGQQRRSFKQLSEASWRNQSTIKKPAKRPASMAMPGMLQRKVRTP